MLTISRDPIKSFVGLPE